MRSNCCPGSDLIGNPTHQDAAMFAAVNNITLNEFVKTAIAFALEYKEGLNRTLENKNREIDLV